MPFSEALFPVVSGCFFMGLLWFPCKFKNDFIEYNEDNNTILTNIMVNPNIPGKSFIFWVNVRYNWDSKDDAPNAPVTVKNMRNGEIIA